MRYVDFDSIEINEYPEAYQRVVVDRDLEPGSILLNDTFSAMWDIQYQRLVEEFEKLGAERIRKAS